jgi:transcriptional regulator with XRE-family HTH domain
MFKQALAEFCLRRGVTKAQAAVIFGASSSTLSLWASGKVRPHPAAAKRVADVLGIDPVKWGHDRISTSTPSLWRTAVMNFTRASMKTT